MVHRAASQPACLFRQHNATNINEQGDVMAIINMTLAFLHQDILKLLDATGLLKPTVPPMSDSTSSVWVPSHAVGEAPVRSDL